MGRIVVSEFVSLDGVMEAPGGGDDYRHAGWTFEVDGGDQFASFKLQEALDAEALLLGRVTYDGFALAWPMMEGEFADKFNQMPKYVVSRTLEDPTWNNSTVLEGEAPQAVAELRERLGGDIVVHGSARLVQTLLEHDLVDELRLMVYPFVLGSGKRLFGAATDKKRLRLTSSRAIGVRDLPAGVRARPGVSPGRLPEPSPLPRARAFRCSRCGLFGWRFARPRFPLFRFFDLTHHAGAGRPFRGPQGFRFGLAAARAGAGSARRGRGGAARVGVARRAAARLPAAVGGGGDVEAPVDRVERVDDRVAMPVDDRLLADERGWGLGLVTAVGLHADVVGDRLQFTGGGGDDADRAAPFAGSFAGARAPAADGAIVKPRPAGDGATELFLLQSGELVEGGCE